jgi:predicted DNA-binding transcriptional regulator AlpA
MKRYSTVQVAKLLGIGNDTLHRWVHTKKVPAPPLQSLGAVSIRLWTEADVEAVRKYKAKHYWGRGGHKKRRVKKNK